MSNSVVDCRIPFAQELIELAKKNEKIVAVCNDSVGSSNLNEFKKLGLNIAEREKSKIKTLILPLYFNSN